MRLEHFIRYANERRIIKINRVVATYGAANKSILVNIMN